MDEELEAIPPHFSSHLLQPPTPWRFSLSQTSREYEISLRLHDTLVVSSSKLDVAAGEAESISGDAAKNVGAVE